MASESFLLFRQSRRSDRRLGVAILASTLLHGLMAFTLLKYSVHDYVFTRPVHAPLSIRLETLPEAAEATPIVTEDRKAPFGRKISGPKPETRSPSTTIAPSQSQPGVTVSDNLYLRPLPGHVDSALLTSGEFRRVSELSEKPETIAMRIPRYPRLAQDQQLSGWVIAMLLLDEQGKVVGTTAVESSELFSDYASEVAEEMRDSTFTPGRLNGRAVNTIMFVTVRFDSNALTGIGAGVPVEVEDRRKH